MRRAVISQPFEITLEETDTPEPEPGQILIRTAVSGISPGTEMNLYCGTNPDLVRRRWGERFVYPMVPGYQVVGDVVQCSPDVTEFEIGDRVFASGSHADYVVIGSQYALKLPDDISNEFGTLLSVARVALHGVRRGRIEYGDTVAVVGMGLMGQLAIQHSRLAGAGKTIAVDLDPWRLELARHLGADHCINPEQGDPSDQIAEYTNGGADVVLETAGAPSAVPLSLTLGRYGARVVIVGWHLKPISVDLAEDLLYKELDLLPSRAGGIDDDAAPFILRWNKNRNMELLIQLLTQKRLLVDKLVTHVIPANEIKQAYEMIRTRSEPSLHIVLDWKSA